MVLSLYNIWINNIHMSGVENFTFENSENRESLRQIKEIQRTAKAERKKHISDTIISSLNWEWLIIASWDTLAHISALTARWNRLSFLPGADNIDVWDVITIKQEWDERYIYKNNEKVWEVLEGYHDDTVYAMVNVRNKVADIVPANDNARKTNRTRRASESIEDQDTYAGWRQLVRFIESEWYKRGAGAWLCGKNVWDTLNRYYASYGISAGLPTSQRHGWKWDSFLRWNPNFLRMKISHPSEAPNGSIISYAAWEHFDWSEAKKDHGHVEIKTASNMFYFGWINRHPGWSANANINLQKSGFTGYAYIPRYIQTDEIDYPQENIKVA